MRQELFPEQWILHPSLMLMINAPRWVSSLKGGVAGRRSDVIYMNVHDLLRLVSSEAAMKQNRARISGAEVCRSFRSFSWRRTWGSGGGGEGGWRTGSTHQHQAPFLRLPPCCCLSCSLVSKSSDDASKERTLTFPPFNTFRGGWAARTQLIVEVFYPSEWII